MNFNLNSMKTLKTTIFAILFLCVACEKIPEENKDNITNDSITYPEEVIYGNNFLFLPDSSLLIPEDEYEIGANLGKDAHLKLVITNLSTNPNPEQMSPIWFLDMEYEGWNIEYYNEISNYQTFISISTGKISAPISFEVYEGKGACRVDFYENSDTITKTKYFFW